MLMGQLFRNPQPTTRHPPALPTTCEGLLKVVYYTIVVHNFNLQEKTTLTVDTSKITNQYNSKMSQVQNYY